MSIFNLSGKLSSTFNWLAETPKRQMTMGEFVPWATDNMLNFPGPPAQMHRAGRIIERSAFALGLLTTAAVAISEASVVTGALAVTGAALGPFVILPFVFKGLGYVSGVMADWTIDAVAGRLSKSSARALGKEYIAQNRQELPRRMR